MGIIYVLVASVFASASNFSMRKTIDYGGTSKAFLMIQLSIAFIVALFLGPIKAKAFAINLPIIFLGILTGLVFGFMMISLGKGLEKGPPGLTIAILNASTVIPGILMALLFGVAFGFEYRFWHGLGSILVLAGLFWSGWGIAGLRNMSTWLFFSLSAFFMHVLFLILMQWRAMMINFPDNASFFRIVDSSQAINQWFMPMIYLSAATMQIVYFFFAEKRIPKKAEWSCGIFGGIANSMCTFFLIWSTEVATSLENAMIFPIFSVGIILLCNGWGQVIYEEKVNWKASQVCTLGLIIGTVDWKAVANFFNL